MAAAISLFMGQSFENGNHANAVTLGPAAAMRNEELVFAGKLADAGYNDAQGHHGSDTE